jgi:RTA1 like protein
MYILVAGLSFQVASIVLFICSLWIIIYAWGVRRIEKNRAEFPLSKTQRLGSTTIGSLIRCFYRVVDLSKRWEEALISTDANFIVLDRV